MIYNADSIEKLKELDENSVDSIVTDPPYFINFMNKKWDAKKHIAAHPDFWTECLRVLKPGGHVLAFGHSRTHHRLFTAIEDAGFQIKDTIMWLYGVGFPKSHNIGKTLQKKLDKITNEIKEFIKNEAKTTEEETELLLRLMRDGHLQKTKHISEKRWKVLLSFLSQHGSPVEEKTGGLLFFSEGKGQSSVEGRNNLQESERKLQGSSLCSLPAGVDNDGEERRLHNGTPTNDGSNDGETSNQKGSGPSHRPRPTKQQKGKSNVVSLQRSAQALRVARDKWEGWGSALKPSVEPICLAQKPREGTYAKNVLKHGVGGINIDASRVGSDKVESNTGRFPANLILSHSDDCKLVGTEVDTRQGGNRTKTCHNGKEPISGGEGSGGKMKETTLVDTYDCVEGCPIKELGGASRFFYCAKSGKRERNKYMPEDAPLKSAETRTPTGAGVYAEKGFNPPRRNHHPTIKPLKLMTYLIKLITPAGGTVLDPFMGSGSTGIAAIEGGWKFVGIEKDKEYYEIAKARLQNCEEQNE